jgi:hypothetical protein
VMACGLHMPHGEHGDLPSEVKGEDERAILHDRYDCVVKVRVHHLLISFLLKRGLCAPEAAIIAIIAIIAIMATGDSKHFDCQATGEGLRCLVARLLPSLRRSTRT